MNIRPSSASWLYRRRRLAVLCAPLGLMIAPAFGQEQTVRMTSSVRVSEMITDNARLESSGSAKSDAITQISPSVRFDARGTRLSGSLGLNLNSTFYASDSSSQSNYLTLSGTGKAILLENRSDVDLLASVSRQSAYSFSPQAADQVTGTGNQTQVRMFSISPNLRERFGGTGSLDLRYSFMQLDSDSTAMNRSESQTLSFTATDPYALGLLGWSVNLRDSRNDNQSYRAQEQFTSRFTGFAQVDPQLTLRLIGGYESNNFAASASRNATVYGVGADWLPTSRSRFSATVEKRFFGTGYSFTGQHRAGNFAFTGSYSRDVSSSSQTLLGALTLYDLLMLQYANTYPNINERSVFVRRLIDTNAQGMSGLIVGAQSVLANGYFLDRRFQGGLTIIGVRNSIAFIAFQSQRETFADRTFALTGSTSTTQAVTTSGASISANHNLSAETSANLSLTSTRSSTADSSIASTRSRIISAGLSSRLSRRTTGSLTVRNNHGSGSSGYTENAVIGVVNFQF